MNVKSYNAPIADTVAAIISEKGLKQSAVAQKIGVTAQQFSDMLNGRRIIKACDVPKIVEALSVTPNDLFEIK